MTTTGGAPGQNAPPSGQPAAAKKGAVLRLGRITGIPVEVDGGFVLVAVLLGAPYWLAGRPETFALGAGFILLLGFSVLVHELAHSWVARLYHIQSRAIRLNAFGGVAHLAAMPTSARRAIAILLAGPFSNLVLYGLFVAILAVVADSASPLVRVFLSQASWINLSLGLFNLLPAFPLDGGRSAYIALASIVGRRAAGLGIALLGLVIVAALALLAFHYGLWLLVVGLILGQSNLQAFQRARAMKT